MNLALDPKLTGQLMTCGKDVFLTLIDLNEKVNAEFFAKPFTRLAFEQMLVAMGGFLAEMFPESDIPAITGTYCVDTGVVDLPNLLPVIEKLVTDNQGLQPIKAKDSKMRNHKHFGTPQDTSFIGDIVRFIAEHGGLRDWEKDLLINRVTAPIDEPESPEVVRAKEGISQPAAHEPADMPTPNSSTSAEVARMTDTTEPLTMSITRDDDGHMCIAIADRKWKIMRHGIIGNGPADREEFHLAASDLVDNALPFSDAGLERVVLASDLLSLSDDARAYRDAMKYRSAISKSLGEVMYDAYCQSLPSSEEKQKLTTWNDVAYKWSWEEAARAAYFSVGLNPDEINKEIQIIAARHRISLLRQTYFCSGNIGERAATINEIAGPAPQP